MDDPKVFNRKSKKEQRQELRTGGIAPEAVLWKYLQKRQLLGKKFRRQESIGPYIVDFYCPECRLIVELDGAVHFRILRDDYEVKRTIYLEAQGLRVLRFQNKELLREGMEFVLETIREALREAGATTPALRATPPWKGGE